MPQQEPTTAYCQTSPLSSEILKANLLAERYSDNKIRKKVISRILDAKDLLSIVVNTRNYPSSTANNLSGYTPRRIADNEVGDRSVTDADDCS